MYFEEFYFKYNMNVVRPYKKRPLFRQSSCDINAETDDNSDGAEHPSSLSPSPSENDIETDFINKKKGWKKKISRKQFRHHDIKLFMPGTNSTTCLLKQKDIGPTNPTKPEHLTKEAMTESIVKSLTPTENHARKTFQFPESSDVSPAEMNAATVRNGKHHLPPVIAETPAVARRRSFDVTASKSHEAPREARSLDMGTFYAAAADVRLPNVSFQQEPNPHPLRPTECPNYNPLPNRHRDYTHQSLPMPPLHQNVFNPDAMTAHYLKLMNNSKNNVESSDIAADYYVKLLYSYMNSELSFQSLESISYAYTFVLHICNRVPGQTHIKRNIKKALNKTVIYVANQLRHLNISPYAVIDIMVNPHRTVEKNNLRHHVENVLRPKQAREHETNLRNSQKEALRREPPMARVHGSTNGGLSSAYPNSQPPPYPYTSAGPFLAQPNAQSSLPDYPGGGPQGTEEPSARHRHIYESHGAVDSGNATWRQERDAPEDRDPRESQNVLKNGSSNSGNASPDKATGSSTHSVNHDDVFEEITQEVVVGNDYTHKLRRVRIGRLPELENQPLPFLAPPMQTNFCSPTSESKGTSLKEAAAPKISPHIIHTVVKLKPENNTATAVPEVGLNLTVVPQKNQSNPQPAAVPNRVSTENEAPETVLNLSKNPEDVPIEVGRPELGLNLTISAQETCTTNDIQTVSAADDTKIKNYVHSSRVRDASPKQDIPTTKKIIRVKNVVVPEVIIADESMQITKESVKREQENDQSNTATEDTSDVHEAEFLELLKKLRHTIPSSKLRRIILNETGIFPSQVQNAEPIEITDSDDECPCDELKPNIDDSPLLAADNEPANVASIIDLSKTDETETPSSENDQEKTKKTERSADKTDQVPTAVPTSKSIYSPEVEPISPTDGESAFIFPEKNPPPPDIAKDVDDTRSINRKRKQDECPSIESTKRTQTDTSTVKIERATTPLLLSDIPKGKLCYFRESNTLLRYFEDNQVELFVENLTDQDDDFIKSLGIDPEKFRDLQSKNAGETRTSDTEIVILPHNVEFSLKEDFLEVEDFVKELKLVEEYVPKDFSSFYRFVTGYQIVRNKNPVSLQTFLVMYNTNRTNDLLAKYIRREQCYTALMENVE